MTPDFDELVAADLDPRERARLEGVHELLVAAGPPPEYSAPPPIELRAPKRRRGLLALAAALAVATFVAGLAVGNFTAGRSKDFDVAMRGTPAAASASATLTVYELDDAGNWPMEVKIRGLRPARGGGSYALWLTRSGKLEALCGTFRTDDGGSASVPMNAPYKFKEYDGWVVVEEGSKTPLLTT